MEYMILQEALRAISVTRLNELGSQGWRVIAAQFAKHGLAYVLLEREAK